MNRTFDPGLGLSVICDQLNTGGNVWAAIKAPVRAATTANISLSGRQTIDGVALVDGDRVLVKDQTLGYQNGIYIASTFGSWGRAPDWDDNLDVLNGTIVGVLSGTTNGGLHYRVSTSDPITVGTTNVALAVAFNAAAATFTPSGTGATSTTVQAKLREFRSVKDFGATGDGTTDDTTAIQAAITAVIGTGGWLFFPDGTYKITSALTIGASSGWRITGWSRGGAIISQATSNTGIFTLTACDTHSWQISDLTLTWASAQTSSNTSSIAIYMSGATGTVANGYYNWQVKRVTFSNGFRAINANETVQLAVWGFKVAECQHYNTMSGAFVRVIPSPSIGLPNLNISNNYIKCDSLVEQAINILGANGLVMNSNEFNNGTVSSSGMNASVVLLTSCIDVVINGIRFENQTIATTVFSLLNISGGQATVQGFEVSGVIVSSAITGYGMRISSSAVVTVNGNHTTATLSGGGAFYTFAGQVYRRLENYSQSGATGSIDPSVQCKYNDALDITSADNGNAAATLLVNSDEKTQIWNTALTADRAVTLSTTGALAGHRFRIIRTANATGAFNLNVGTGPLKAMGTAGSFADVEYDGSAWFLAAYGAL